ncbi:MAG: prolipoprotein diacylglyceryl transferase [Eubacterium sp.]|nr:prolipoprotein diacylglyceryl transferase [Eubacterium sp.]
MQVYINIFGFTIPSYGLMILIGIAAANFAALPLIRIKKADINEFVILEGYAALGALIGSKLLYFLVSFQSIDWSRMTDLIYLSRMMQNGFVFYGGLIGGLLFLCLGGRIHRIDFGSYLRNFIFMVPLAHGFGRIGCFLSGCCYGIPYDGPGAVIFPEGSFALSGVPLFPVQLTEAVCLFVLAGILFVLTLKTKFSFTLECYLITYAVLRFILEFFRFDEARGRFGPFSTSQWISIILFAAGLFLLLRKVKRKEIRYSKQ